MRLLKTTLITLALASFTFGFPVRGSAADLGGKVVIAFTQPVQVPGMVLQPGAYVFKTSPIDKHVVLIFDGSETHLLTTLMTVSAYRLEPSAKSVVFEESVAGSPQALQSWFPAGEVAGREFIYPSAEAGK